MLESKGVGGASTHTFKLVVEGNQFAVAECPQSYMYVFVLRR